MTKSKRSKKQKKDKKDKIHLSNNINIKINTGEKKTKRKYTKRETKHKAQFGNGAQYPHTQAIIPQPLPKPEPDYNALAREYLAPIPDRARRNLLIADGAPPTPRLATPIVMNKVVKRTRRPPAINMDSYADLMKLSFKDLKQLFKDEGVPAEGLKRFTKASQKPEAIREFLDHKAQPQHSAPPRAETPATVRHQRGILSAIGRFHSAPPRHRAQSDDDNDGWRTASSDDESDNHQDSPIHRRPFDSQTATTATSAHDTHSGVATTANLGMEAKRGRGRPKGSRNQAAGGGAAYMAGHGPFDQPAPPNYPNPAEGKQAGGRPPSAYAQRYLDSVRAGGIPGSPSLNRRRDIFDNDLHQEAIGPDQAFARSGRVQRSPPEHGRASEYVFNLSDTD